MRKTVDTTFGIAGAEAMGAQSSSDGTPISTRVIDGDARKKKDPSIPAVVFMRNPDQTVLHHFEVSGHNPRDPRVFFEPVDFQGRVRGEVAGPHSIDSEIDSYINNLREQGMAPEAAVGMLITESVVEVYPAEQDVA